MCSVSHAVRNCGVRRREAAGVGLEGGHVLGADGKALHENYWKPRDEFGTTATNSPPLPEPPAPAELAALRALRTKGSA